MIEIVTAEACPMFYWEIRSIVFKRRRVAGIYQEGLLFKCRLVQYFDRTTLIVILL